MLESLCSGHPFVCGLLNASVDGRNPVPVIPENNSPNSSIDKKVRQLENRLALLRLQQKEIRGVRQVEDRIALLRMQPDGQTRGGISRVSTRSSRRDDEEEEERPRERKKKEKVRRTKSRHHSSKDSPTSHGSKNVVEVANNDSFLSNNEIEEKHEEVVVAVPSQKLLSSHDNSDDDEVRVHHKIKAASVGQRGPSRDDRSSREMSSRSYGDDRRATTHPASRHHKEPLSTSSKEETEEEALQRVGKALHARISQRETSLAGKITGMILSLGRKEAETFLTNETALLAKIEEAKGILQKEYAKNEPSHAAKPKGKVAPAASKKAALDGKIDDFDSMHLPDELLRGVYAYGFEKPSLCQSLAVAPIMNRKDTVIQSQTGTGKTAAYVIPMLASLDLQIKTLQALILCHNRELAGQVQKVVAALSDFMQVSSALLVGGTSVGQDLRTCKAGVQVVVGVPGRVYDMIKRAALDVSKAKLLILDDGEQLLSRSTKDQMYDIFQACPSNIQSVVVCVHYDGIAETCGKFLRPDVTRLLITTDQVPLENIKYFYVAVDREQFKFDTLCDLYETLTITQCFIFCNTSRKVDWLTEEMRKRDFTATALHGDMSQSDRETILRQFRSGACRVLITTDALSHGIDVQQVSLVLSYDLSTTREEFIHRAGRAGRFGRKGVSLTFATDEDVRSLQDIERAYSITIPPMPSDINDLI